MIVVVGRVSTDASRREALVEVARKVASTSRREQGCMGYRIYEDIEQPNEFVFVEEWESEEALNEHFGTPHIAEFMRAVPGNLVGPPDVKFHTIASTRDLSEVAPR